MRMRPTAWLVLALCTTFAAAQDKTKPEKRPEESQKDEEKVTAETATSPLDFTMKDIDGEDVRLSKFKGKVVLIVNVASKCGYTSQYRDLQSLHERYGKRGLRIFAFPANNFSNQEPGTNAEIKAFCQSKYNVNFDLFEKVSVRGPNACELYKFLESEEKNPVFGGPIGWNFTKFLVNREGQVIDRFPPRLEPKAGLVTRAIEKALKATPEKPDKPAKPARPANSEAQPGS